MTRTSLLTTLVMLLASVFGPAAAPVYAQEDSYTLFLPTLLRPAGAEDTVSAAAAPMEKVIVVLHDTVGNPGAVASELAQRHNGNVGFVYQHALKGASMSVPGPALAGIQRDPRVKYVETDDPVVLFAQTVPTGIDRIFASANANLDIDGADDFRVNVDVAVIDTGIDLQHPDLNVVASIDCTSESGGGPPWARKAECVSGGDDDHYHGTHVAGTIAALDNGIGVVGVAPGARLHAVKVLRSNGSGTESMVVAGIDWVAANAATIEVANMSLGGSGHSQAEYDAIQGAVNKGVAFAVAAGNSSDNANNYSPARFDNVLTVSALADFDGIPGGIENQSVTFSSCTENQDDTLACFSNYGDAVDIAAPGVLILSTFPLEQGEYGAISGTSMASPHVAGALALLSSNNNPGNATDVQNLYDQVTGTGNFDWTDDSGDGIHEPLLDVSSFGATLIPGDDGGSTNNPPNAGFSFTTSGLTVNFTDTSTDSDGTISAWSWDFGDNTPTSTGQNPSHTYTSGGTYNVTLTVTDNDGATDSNTQSMTVTEPPTGNITLVATGYKVKGLQKADLSWGGATSGNVDVFHNGGLLTTTANDGAYTDAINQRGGGSYTYQICEAGTSTCSNTVTVTF